MSLSNLKDLTIWKEMISTFANFDISRLSLKSKIVAVAVSCGIWALATFIFGKVVMV